MARQYGPLAGRILLALIFLISGYEKIGGGLMLVFGWKACWAALALLLWLIPVTLLFHNYWAADAAQYQNQLNHFMKNLCIMGGMLYIMAFGAGPVSLDHRRN